MATAPSPAPRPTSVPGANTAPGTQPTAPKRWDWLYLPPLFYFVSVAIIVWLFVSSWISLQGQRPMPPNTGTAQATARTGGASQADAEVERLKDRLALEQDYLEKRAAQVDKRADDLEHLIVEMTIASSAYTLLLAVVGYFGLKTIKDEARSDLAKIEGLLDGFQKGEFAEFKKELRDSTGREIERTQVEFERFRSEVRNDIPELYGMARSLEVILNRIRRQIDLTRSGTLREAYEKMNDEDRETVLVAEMTVAGFDYFGLPHSKIFRPVASQIYVSLANFYAARSRSIAGGPFNQADMKRALIYIDRACATDDKNANAFSQRAALLLVDVQKPGDAPSKKQLEDAERDLEKSLELKANDVRALYNLAWIARRAGKLTKAIDLLTKIIDAKATLDPEDRGRRVIDAYTNRACYRALGLNPLPPNAKTDVGILLEAGKIMDDCKGACEEGRLYNLKEYCRKGFTREFGATGDLAAIKPLLPAKEVDEVIACI